MHAGLVATAAASLLADQVSKLLVRSPRVRVGVGRRTDGRILGARPFGARAGLSTPALWLIWLVLAAGALLAPAAGWLATPGARFGLGLALGGAAGNLVDVSVRGGVVDFIDLKVWPAFNVADVAIVAGVAVALASG